MALILSKPDKRYFHHLQAFSAPVQRTGSDGSSALGSAGSTANGVANSSPCGSRLGSRLGSGGSAAVAGAVQVIAQPLQSVCESEPSADTASSATAALLPPDAEVMQRNASGAAAAAPAEGDAAAALPHGAPAAARRPAEQARTSGAAASGGCDAASLPTEAASRLTVRFDGSTAAGSAVAAASSRDKAAAAAANAAPEGAEASGVSASIVGSLPEFTAFPVAGCADMGSRVQRVDDGSFGHPPSSDLHTTALGNAQPLSRAPAPAALHVWKLVLGLKFQGSTAFRSRSFDYFPRGLAGPAAQPLGAA